MNFFLLFGKRKKSYPLKTKILDIQKKSPKTHVYITEKNHSHRISFSALERRFFWKVFLGSFFFLLLSSFSSSFISSYASSYREVFPEGEFSGEYLFVDDSFSEKPEVFSNVGDMKSGFGIVQYTTQKSETVISLARQFGVTSALLSKYNIFAENNRISSGTVVNIPVTDGVFHLASSGENLFVIAELYHTDSFALAQENGLSEDVSLSKGQEIFIPGKRILNFDSVPYDLLFFPTKGKYTQGYHYGHYAVDIAHGGGAPIYAADGGVVIKAQGGWNGGYGNVVVIDHENGMKTLYAHQRELYVSVGDRVQKGEEIGYMGNTGRTRGVTGIHLHFEVMVNDIKRNPLAFFEK